MIHPPLSVVESWPPPNYVDPQTRGYLLLVLAILLCVLCIVAVILRLWSRLRILGNAGIDDVLIVVALIPTLGVTVVVPISVYKYGGDRHVWDVPLDEVTTARMLSWIAQLFFLISTTLTKLSILLFYRRMTAGSMRYGFIVLVKLTFAFICAYFIAMVAILLLGCRPIHAYWDSVLPTYTEPYVCYDETVSLPISCVISVATDIVVMALPCYLVMGMQMAPRRKLMLMAIFAVGIFVVISGAMRLYNIIITTVQSYDEFWGGYPVWGWTLVENNVAIICSCAPAFKPFFKRYLGTAKTSGYIDGSGRPHIVTIGGSVGLQGTRRRGFVNDINVMTELSVLDRAIDDDCKSDVRMLVAQGADMDGAIKFEEV